MKLTVNIDHIATLRNARGEFEPDPVHAALIAEKAGADGIVCHLREDRRHIKDEDVFKLRESISTKLDLEMAAVPKIINIARKVKPELATIVPERRKELTTEGGLDLQKNKNSLKRAIELLHEKEIKVSLFVDPVKYNVEIAKEINADMIEIHTGKYAEAKSKKEKLKHLHMIRETAKYGKEIGLGVNAGHGLNYTNIFPIVRVKDIDEVSIGYAIIVRAVYVGLENAVREMKNIIKRKLK
ncbi:MAG: Pyridoxine 5'-phosphate synthase [Ignavibacteriae bacterium]|nr:MAG: Pyridoxine 5'-phosphate synthase [Ignavibacteriota bacterium]